MCLFAEGRDCAVSAEICQVCIWMSTSLGNRLCFSHGHKQIFIYLFIFNRRYAASAAEKAEGVIVCDYFNLQQV